MRRPPAHRWPTSRRKVRRVALLGALVFFGLPIAASALITATFAGWTSVLVAVVFWVAIIVVGSLALRLAIGTFAPVSELIAATGLLAEGDYSARVSRTDSPAIRPVVESFNQMAERLEVSDDLRRRLLADVGHELRTPLTIIRGEVEAMVDGVRDFDVDGLRLVLDDVDAMERLLDDLRLLSTIEAGMVRLDREDTDIAHLLEGVVERFQGQAREQGITITSNAPTGMVASIDPDRVSQVLANLVVNALRAVSGGDRIELSARSLARADGGSEIRIEVRDTGRGIEPDRLPGVFDRFQKSTESIGSGLGLTISRDLVTAHGGTIEIQSVIGVGTSVNITFFN